MATTHEVSKGRPAHNLAQIACFLPTLLALNSTFEQRTANRKVNLEKGSELKSAVSGTRHEGKGGRIYFLDVHTAHLQNLFGNEIENFSFPKRQKLSVTLYICSTNL